MRSVGHGIGKTRVTLTRFSVPLIPATQDDALLAKGAGEKGMDLINDQHAHLELPSQGSNPMAQGRDTGAQGKYTSHSGQNFFVEVPLVGLRGHLNGDDRDARPAEFPVKMGAVIAQKFLNDARLAHAGGAVDNQARHAVAGRVIDQVRQALENALGARVLEPIRILAAFDKRANRDPFESRAFQRAAQFAPVLSLRCAVVIVRRANINCE